MAKAATGGNSQHRASESYNYILIYNVNKLLWRPFTTLCAKRCAGTKETAAERTEAYRVPRGKAKLTNQGTKRIFLWTPPRSLSTVFQLSICTLPNVKTFLEPYSTPYFRSKPLKVMPDSPLKYSYEEADKMIQVEYPGNTAIFVKDFPHKVQGRYEAFLDDGFKDFTHSFLIHNPQRVVLSLYRAVDYELESFLELYERGEVGIVALYEYHCFLRSRLGINPVIIDADDLLANPEQMMEAYCSRVGLTYKEGMTQWEPWPQPGSGWHDLHKQDFFDPGMNQGWVNAAITSSGFTGPTPLPPLPEDLPFEVKKCIDECFVPYNELYSLRMTV